MLAFAHKQKPLNGAVLLAFANDAQVDYFLRRREDFFAAFLAGFRFATFLAALRFAGLRLAVFFAALRFAGFRAFFFAGMIFEVSLTYKSTAPFSL